MEELLKSYNVREGLSRLPGRTRALGQSQVQAWLMEVRRAVQQKA